MVGSEREVSPERVLVETGYGKNYAAGLSINVSVVSLSWIQGTGRERNRSL